MVTRLRVLHDDVLREAVEARQISASVAREITKLTVEAAAELRRRVQAGEKLQMRAVAEARARLVAAGIVNPRRKRSNAVGDDGAEPAPPATSDRPEVPPESARPTVHPADTVDSLSHLAPWRIAPLIQAPTGNAAPRALRRRRPKHPRRPGPAVVLRESTVDTATATYGSEAERHEERDTALSRLNRLEAAPPEILHVEALVKALDEQGYDRVTEILGYGVSQGWSCAALLQMVLCAQTGV